MTAISNAAAVLARNVFKTLRDAESPFDGKASKNLKRLAIVILCAGFVTGAAYFAAAAVVYAFALVIDYGAAEKRE